MEGRLYKRVFFKQPTINDQLLYLSDTRVQDLVQETKSAHVFWNKTLQCIHKVMGYDSQTSGSIESPYRHEYAQCLMQYLLSEYVVTPKLSPHICMFYGAPTIIVNKMMSVEAPFPRYISFYMEHCNKGDVLSYYSMFKKVHGKSALFDAHFLCIVFQVAWTLVATYTVLPNFRHNDLKANNVFVDMVTTEENTQGYTSYTITDRGICFYVPNRLGISVRIGDFDFSCAAGTVDNYKVLEYEMMMPQLNINTRRNTRTDLAFFVKCLYLLSRNSLSARLRTYIESLYGKVYLETHSEQMMREDGSFTVTNYGRCIPAQDHNIPNAYTVLVESRLFSCFRDPVGAAFITASYAFKAGEPRRKPPVLAIPSWCHKYAYQDQSSSYQRVVPCLLSYSCERPSQALFVRLSEGDTFMQLHNDLVQDRNKMTEQLVWLFKQRHMYCHIESSAKALHYLFSKLEDGQSRLPRADALEIEAYYLLNRVLYDMQEHTTRTCNLYVCEWTDLVMNNRCTAEQFLQVLIQISWMEKE